MPDSNPTLTKSLMGERNSLMSERGDILKRISELNSMLDMNSTQIEATDTLMLRFNPEHVAIDVRMDLEGSPLVVVQRPPLQLESSTSQVAIEQAAPVAEPKAKVASEKAPAKTKTAKKTSTKKPAAKKAKTVAAKVEAPKLSTEEEVAAVDAAVAAKPERSLEMQAMSEYFQKSNRNETILQILRGMSEPVSAKTVAGHYRALYPLQDDSAKMRTLHNSRISAALHYLKDRGQATRSADEKGEGKLAENVRWELSKSYRTEMKRSKPSTKKADKMNGHSPLPHQKQAEAPQSTMTTH